MPVNEGSASVERLSAELAGLGIASIARMKAVADHFGELAVAEVRMRASGSPGPSVVTGTYINSIISEVKVEGPVVILEVGTDENGPQANRLEFGFAGTDSLGRRYFQTPYPHFGPAADALELKWEEAMTEAAMVTFLSPMGF